jgi:rare lipoprotein A
MSASASSYKRKKKANPWIAPRVRAISTFVLAILFLTGMICDADEQHHLPTTHATKSDHGSHAVVLTLADSKPIVIAAAVSSEDSRAWSASPAICSLESTPDLSLIDMPPQRINLIPLLTMQPAGQEILEEVGVMIGGAGSGSVDLLSYARRKLLPDFGTTYRALARRVALAGLRRVQDEPALGHTTVMGTVSTYNPFRGGKLEGGPETASGEIYDPTAWTAAIKTELRNRFRGVRYGRLYQPAFALVESGAKQLIVKINDVGPLRPGRVLDLNERSMRHFDPFLTRGLIDDVKITVLPGEDWIPGPVGSAYAIGLQDTQWRTASAQSEPSEPANQLVESETANAPIVYAAHPRVKTHILAEMVPNGGG